MPNLHPPSYAYDGGFHKDSVLVEYDAMPIGKQHFSRTLRFLNTEAFETSMPIDTASCSSGLETLKIMYYYYYYYYLRLSTNGHDLNNLLS